MSSKESLIRPELALVAVTALWGTSFILLSISLKGLSPALLVTLRFGGGALLMACLLRGSLFKLRKTDWIAGVSTGFFIFLGYFLQTIGLQTITSSISAFLTALYVPFVPLFQFVLFRKKPSPIVTGGIVFAFIGMMLILDPTTISLSGSIGEWLTIASAAACAMEIIVLGHFANECDPKAFCFTQLVTVSMLSGLYCLGFEEVRFEPTMSTYLCMLILIGMIVFNQVAMCWAQKFVSPSRAVLIYTLEPVFAGIIGYAVGEPFTVSAVCGAVMVVLSILVSSWLPGYLTNRGRVSKEAA